MLVYDLIRIALGTQDSLSRDYSGSEWQACFNLAKKQGIDGVCFGAIENILSESSGLNLKPSLKRQWIARALAEQSIYNKHKLLIGKLASFYSSISVKMLLLKGYGLSLYYPVPENRPVGDIDIYLFDKTEFADKMIEKKFSINVDDSYLKHSHFVINGVSVENHFTFLDVENHKSNVRFEEKLERNLKIEPSSIPNCFFPSATWNALYLLRHTGEHFATNEITLRHLLDFGIFLWARHDEIDWNYVLGEYKEEGMLPLYDAIATICVRDFRIPDKYFEGFSFDSDLADKVLDDILAEKKMLPMTSKGLRGFKLFKYCVDKSVRWWHNRWKYKMVYKENMFESFFTLAKNRMAHR